MPRGISVDKYAPSKAALEQAQVCRGLSNEDLTARLEGAAVIEQKVLAFLLACLAEFDRRKLYADLGYSSLFGYATRKLGYSEDAAAKRIYAARAANRFPAVLSMLDAGEIHLSAVVLLAPHLTPENHQGLLDGARGKTRRELEFVVAGLSPREIEMDCVRRLPEPDQAQLGVLENQSPPTAPAAIIPRQEPYARLQPISPQRVRFSFTGSQELLRKMDRAKELLFHKRPYGRLEEIIEEIVEVFLDRKDPDRRMKRLDAKKSARTVGA